MLPVFLVYMKNIVFDLGRVVFAQDPNKSSDEFKCQINLHREKMKEVFGLNTTTFANTEMVYADYIGVILSELGFKGVLTEGAKHVLGWRSPNYVYSNPIAQNLKILFIQQIRKQEICLKKKY